MIIKPSTFTENYINLNRNFSFSFKGREYFKPIYDSNANVELFLTGRQCAKSTFLVNRMIARGALLEGRQILFEAPRERQSKQFSKQKLRSILINSPKLKPFLTLNSKGGIEGMSILQYECFKSGASITLSTTYDGGDRDRGASMHDLYVDETQDQLEEDITVIAESLSAATDPYMAWAGTPKSHANYIEQLWQRSKQIYWKIRCEGCGKWQLPGDPDRSIELHKVITPKGLLCEKCEKKIDVLNGLWVEKNSSGTFNGWHISQLMRLVKDIPGSIQWTTPEGIYGIYDKFKYYTPAKFYNEVLGFSYDSSEKPLKFSDLKNISLNERVMAQEFDPSYFLYPVIMGIDWGRNNVNYTVVSISVLYKGYPHLVYMRRLNGAESDPKITTKIIKELYRKFSCKAVYCDNGMFWHYEHEIRNLLGNDFVNNNFNFCHYWQDSKFNVRKSFKNKKRLWKVSRNEVMNLFINHIKQKLYTIFNFKQFTDEKFHMDFLSVGYEVRSSKDKTDTLFFMTSGEGGSPTDCFHSALYGWLGLLIESNKLKWGIDDSEKKEVVPY